MSVRIAGIFDLGQKALLGNLLIFLEELLILAAPQNERAADVFLINRQAAAPRSAPAGQQRETFELPSDNQSNPVISALFDFAVVRKVFLGPDLSNVVRFLHGAGGYERVWPDLDRLREGATCYGSTVLVQSVFAERGGVPTLSMSPARLHAAETFLERHVHSRIPIVVHLKNSRGAAGESNADFAEWHAFFRYCQSHHKELCFVLIGNEGVPEKYVMPGNVLLTAALGSDLATDLALIQLAYAFLGMSSGPCQMALFSEIPYLIYKNPGHHPAEMKIELGEADAFPFATPLQKFLRIGERREDLALYVRNLVSAYPLAAWKKRVAGLLAPATLNG